MAYLSSLHHAPYPRLLLHHRYLFFSASSPPPVVTTRRLVPTLACHGRDLLDVMPYRDSRPSGTEGSRAGPGGAPRVTNSSTVRGNATAQEAHMPMWRERTPGTPRTWKKGDRVMLQEHAEGESQEKSWRRGLTRSLESKGPMVRKSWTRDGNGMRAKESGKVGNSRDEGTGRRNACKKMKKPPDGEYAGKLRVELDMCSKRGDVMGAITLYDSAVEEGIKLGQHHYNVLLYLCSSASLGFVQPAKSGNMGSGIASIGPAQKLDPSPSRSLGGSEGDNAYASESHVQDQGKNKADLIPGGLKAQTVSIPVEDELGDYARARGFEIFDKMCSEKERVQMSEAALTAKARMALSMGDSDMAFEIVKQMKGLGLKPKLRSYGPALTAFCNSGNVEKAFEVEAHMLESGITPEEAELETLLRASVVGRRGDKVYYLLHKFRTAVRQVSHSTAELFEAWFRSPTASKVGKRKWDAGAIAKAIENNGGGWHGFGWLGRGKWTVAHSNINENGVCLACGEKLAIIDLDPKETEDFATFVAKLAIKRERKSNFENFQKWLEKHGPFEAVVDAANVGLFSHKHLSLSKVNSVADAIRLRFTSKKWPLIVLHNKHLIGERMKKLNDHKLVQKWKQENSIYATPTGSNDDCSGTGCTLLSDANA
uniref:ribonuclease P n=1 Tax=Zea mays TaxID=4577 RepID=A0A804PG98_MAIZE